MFKARLKAAKLLNRKGFVYISFVMRTIRTMACYSILSSANKPIMQKALTFVLAVFLIGFAAFKPASGLDDVISALRSGNANELAKYVDDQVEIGLPEKTDTYSKSQALIVLQDFFSNNGVRGFQVIHKGDNAGGQFCVGTLQTRAGNYRATVFMKTKNGKQSMKEIRFQST
jgi:hypothetical protein